MSQQRVAAAECEPVLAGRGQGKRGDLPVQVTDRHQAAPADAARDRRQRGPQLDHCRRTVATWSVKPVLMLQYPIRLRKLEKIVSDLPVGQMALSQEREIGRLREELALARLDVSLDGKLSTMKVRPR